MRRIALCSLGMMIALEMIGCGGSSSGRDSFLFTKVAVSTTANPLVASYTFTVPTGGVATIAFGPDQTYGFKTSSQTISKNGGTVTFLVAGMKPGSTYHMQAKVSLSSGAVIADRDRAFATGALPAGTIPTFTEQATSGLTPQPGVELVDTLLRGGASLPVAFATDLDGNVIWEYACPDCISGTLLYPIKLLSNGHFLTEVVPNSTAILTAPSASLGPNYLREIDLAGTTIRQLGIAELNASLAAAGFNLTLQIFSHDFAILPNGHFLVIANTLRAFSDLPGFPGTTNVLGDCVIDLDPDFKPVWVWNEFDHLDVNRHPMGFPDWTHSNAIAYSPDDGNFLISLRHQNWILKVDYKDGAGQGDILWKLGEGGDFTLQGGVDPTDWFYAQHDVNFISSNTTGVFKVAIMDNGDDRQFPGNVICDSAGALPCHYSTIPIMQIDENAKTASFLFHQIEPADFYSSFAGSTRVLQNTNVEYNLSAVGNDAYVFEVTPTATPQTVWQMHLSGTNTYRSFRMPSLYPGVQW